MSENSAQLHELLRLGAVQTSTALQAAVHLLHHSGLDLALLHQEGLIEVTVRPDAHGEPERVAFVTSWDRLPQQSPQRHGVVEALLEIAALYAGATTYHGKALGRLTSQLTPTFAYAAAEAVLLAAGVREHWFRITVTDKGKDAIRADQGKDAL